MSVIIVSHDQGQRRVALVAEGRLLEYGKELAGEGPQAEAVYLGRVSRVMKALNAVFVRLSPDDEGFLPLEAGQRLRPGDDLVVQVKKPPTGGKSAFLTCDIALAGQYVLLMPRGSAHHVSKRVESEEERQALLDMAGKLSPPDMALVMRESSARAKEQDLRDEVGSLAALWHEIRDKAASASAPSLLHQAPDRLSQMLRDTRPAPQKIISDRQIALKDHEILIEIAQDPFSLYDVEGQLAKALRRKHLLKSGASIVIDPCEAMTVIDVNSAQSVHGRDKEQAVLKVNMEAVADIAWLIRLRNISGIILIDFIDMAAQPSRDALLSHLEQALKDDPIKTVVHGFTHLGMVEMTRRRAGAAHLAQTLDRCPHCQGRGYL